MEEKKQGARAMKSLLWFWVFDFVDPLDPGMEIREAWLPFYPESDNPIPMGTGYYTGRCE